MKVKRILSMLITACMLLSLIPAVSFAADTPMFKYSVYVDICDIKSAECKKKNAIQVTFTFDDNQYEYAYLTNTKRNNTATATLETTKPPWTLDSVKLENSTKDSLWMYYIYINVEYNGKSMRLMDSKLGTDDKRKTGKPIDKDDGGPKSYTVSRNVGRKIDYNGLENYNSELNYDIHLDPSGESGSIKHEWNGEVKDNYSIIMSGTGEGAYKCLGFGGAPTLSVSVSGVKGDTSQVTQDNLKKNGIVFGDYGYTINKATLLQYMNDNNLNRIVLGYTLRFPYQSTEGNRNFYAETRIIRDVFSVENVSFSTNYKTAAKDNYYYNQSSNKINVSANIISGKNYNMFDTNTFVGKTLQFEEAYIEAGNYKLAEKNASSVKIGSGNTINLSFAYDKDIDSGDNGITLFLKNARIEYDGTTYKLWDEYNHKIGFSNQNNGRDGYYKSTHKLDSKNPTVAINPAAGVDLTKWNKTVTLSAVPSEDIYIQPVQPNATRAPGYSNMNLTDGSNKLSIYNYKGSGTPNKTQTVPSLKNSEKEITLALRDNAEGEYDLVLSGEDFAGNKLSSVYKGIKLDNKAPEISVTEKQEPRKSDGTKGNIYNVTIKDKSGTGRLYYMFTTKSIKDAPVFDENNAQKSSGDMDTTLEQWAYIDQADAANGVSAYIKVDKGKNFSGRMLYFAVDQAGNKTGVSSKDINIQNEDTACDITPKNVDKPLPAYDIKVDTNSNNTIWYRWKNAADNKYITDFKQYNGKSIDTSTDNATKSLNGTYILECKIVPPSVTNINYVSTSFVFDNEGPSINLTAPSADVSSLMQSVSVYAADLSDVASATGKLVNPDGTDIEGNEEFALNVRNGILSQIVSISDIPSGVYALKVTAVDTHGASASEISDAFIIRNEPAAGTVDVQSELSYAGRPLISGDSFKLCFEINESFANPSYAKDQELYYRISTASGEYGEWLDAGSVSPSESIPNALAAKLTVDAPQMAFADGANTLFVQTVICSRNTDKISLDAVKNDEIVFYYDNTAPTANLVINDYHTKESISGKLYVSDSFDSSFTAVCGNPAVDISEPNSGVFDITVKENADTSITVSDTAGNTTDVKLVIKGIDTTAPTADIQTSEKAVGARKDAAATVKVNDVLDGAVEFAFIPVDKYTGNEIPDEYLQDNLENINFSVSEVNNQRAAWDGESCITYNAVISGVTGEWYLGVRAADSLGNSTDIVFNENVLKAEDAELSLEISANPVKTEKKTIATVSYNVPVYTLPQDKIVDASSDVVTKNTLGIDEFDTLTDAEKVEAANIELAKQYAIAYSDKYSFAAGKNDDYDLYTVDDLGRTKHLKATLTGVTFDAASGIKVTKAKKERQDYSSYVLTPYEDDEMICAASFTSEDYVIVEPADSGSDTLLLPINPYDYNTIYNTNALIFEEGMSYSASGDSGSETEGYKKLVYRVEQIYNADGEYGDDLYADTTERIVTVLAFTAGADINDPAQVSEKTAVITGIDNTAPIVRWSVSPEVLTYEDVLGDDGQTYKELVKHPTPGDVAFTITAQDKELGIKQIKALSYTDENDKNVDVFVPMKDSEDNPTEYWVWDGSEHTAKENVYDEETGETIDTKISSIPVKVEYFGDGDIYGVKMLKYTFSDAYTLMKAGIFTNTLDGEEFIYTGSSEGALSTEGIIYKMPIEEGEDYNIKYYLENAAGNWEELTDLENTYYKNAKAVIDIPEGGRGEERGLYVSNNSRQNEKVLNNYQHEFTFELRDKYGYTKYVSVSLNNFDVVPGEIEYNLQTTEKTNEPYNITINASDNESGVGKVILTLGGTEISLTQGTDGQYSGEISKNGTYSITLYDKVGNKTVKSFNVKNIDTTVPTASVTYSIDGEVYTSHPVSAALYFSKPNVRITKVEPLEPLTSSDYSVNYSTSTITFTKSGTVSVFFEDDYGNSGAKEVAVKNIDKTPPKLEAVKDPASDTNSVSVSFNKVDDLTSAIDMARKESEIFVTYGGITKAVADENGNKNSFVFHQNGNYTFKVHDKEGLSSFLTVAITDIDTAAPKIKSVSWSYDYDVFDDESQAWVTKRANETYKPTEGKAGYVVASDQYSVTNQDVNVTVETDSETRLVGSNDDYTTLKEKTYDQNGLFIFNTEKRNGLGASYGVDIAIIDKTPPTIDLLGKSELVFYENPSMNTEYDISMLQYTQNGKYEAYKAYDVFNGRKEDLTANVEIDWGGFNPTDLSQNTFDSSKPYTITYSVADSAHNIFEAKRTVRLVGMYDTIALVNGQLPDFTGTSEVVGDKISISLANFAGTAYVRYQSGIYTMGQMKKLGTMLSKSENGEFEVSGLDEGWYTFYIQTDKRDYFTIRVYLSK